MPVQIIQMMAFTQIMAISTPWITPQDHLKCIYLVSPKLPKRPLFQKWPVLQSGRRWVYLLQVPHLFIWHFTLFITGEPSIHLSRSYGNLLKQMENLLQIYLVTPGLYLMLKSVSFLPIQTKAQTFQLYLYFTLFYFILFLFILLSTIYTYK